jgi:hypothetical protein
MADSGGGKSVTPHRASRSVFVGIVFAVLFMLVAGAAGYFYLAKTGALTRTDNIQQVAVVFASHAEDGAQVAGVVALVSQGGRSVRLLDPEQAVTIPGTSFSKLGDAYPFGGGKTVADVLSGSAAGPAAYVDVAEADWIALLERGGAVEVVVPKALEVFDGTRLVSFAEGTQTVPAADVPSLLRGANYLASAERMWIVDAVGEASIDALAAEGARTRVKTNLTAGAYSMLLAGMQAR